MPVIRSLIHDMRSRLRHVVQHGSSMAEIVTDGLKQSSSVNMPQELLRKVLLRIEDSESSWPPRKSVVACAGVCWSWREITKEIIKPPEVSAKDHIPELCQAGSFTMPSTKDFGSLHVSRFNGTGEVKGIEREGRI